MQAQRFGFDAICHIRLQRPDRTAPAHTRANAQLRAYVADPVGDGTRVGKYGAFPVGDVAAQGNRALLFNAADGHIAPAVEQVVVYACANLAVAVAAHGGVATG